MRLILAISLALNLVFSINVLATENEVDSAQNQTLIITKINILGNKTTKSWVILRELSFEEGDTLTKFELLTRFESSKQNLTNTSLFNFTDFRFVLTGTNEAQVYVNVTERWYFWPRPIFELAETNLNSWWENKDFSRINYGLEFTQNNFRGRNEKLKLILQFGFTEKIGLSYSIPYINKKRTLGLTVYSSYGQNHEVNYLSENNKRLFYKDVDRVQLRDLKSGITFKYRRKFYSSHLFGSEYNQVGVTDSILFYNEDFLPERKKESKYLSLSYRYILDRRDNKNYPLIGHFFSAWVVKHGLGVFAPNVDLWWNKIEFRQYSKLSQRFYLAGLFHAHLYANDFQPYFFRDGLGYKDKSTVRAYELYVIDAQQMGTAKLQLRYQIIAPKAYEMAMMPVNKFKKFHYSLYLGVFGDIGYARDVQKYPMNDLANDLQSGYGISLDLATYYDMVFRTEYSINKFGEHGLFLHFVAPI